MFLCYTSASGASSDREPSTDGTEEEETVHKYSLLPPAAPDSTRRPVSVIETDTDPDSYSVEKGEPPTSPRRASSPSLSSDEDNTLPEVVQDDVDCLSDGSKKERAIQAQIEACLAPSVAQHAYVQLCRLIGQETLRR